MVKIGINVDGRLQAGGRDSPGAVVVPGYVAGIGDLVFRKKECESDEQVDGKRQRREPRHRRDVPLVRNGWNAEKEQHHKEGGGAEEDRDCPPENLPFRRHVIAHLARDEKEPYHPPTKPAQNVHIPSFGT